MGPSFFFFSKDACVGWVDRTILMATFRLSDGLGCSSIVGNKLTHHLCSLMLIGCSCLVFENSLASFLPPSTTIRRYHRNLLSTTSIQLGTVYCAILSFTDPKAEPDIQEIISALLAVRAKLNRSDKHPIWSRFPRQCSRCYLYATASFI